MVLKKISNDWWMLQSDDGILKLTWFGTRDQVIGRFNAYIRSLDLDAIRYKPKHK